MESILYFLSYIIFPFGNAQLVVVKRFTSQPIIRYFHTSNKLVINITILNYHLNNTFGLLSRLYGKKINFLRLEHKNIFKFNFILCKTYFG